MMTIREQVEHIMQEPETYNEFRKEQYNKLRHEIQKSPVKCQHKNQSSSSGGWYCLDCGAMWNSKGKRIK